MKVFNERQFRLIIRLAVSTLAGLLIAILPAAASGQTVPLAMEAETRAHLDNLQTQADALKKEVDALGSELEIVVERHNGTRIELETLTKELADSRARLESMRMEQYAQEKILTDRLKSIYKAGDINFLSILLSSNSFSDLMGQARYMAKISEQDIKLETEYRARTDEMAAVTDEIDRQRALQLRLEKALAQQEEQIEAKIDERQQKLDSVDAQVREILDREAERQRAEQARLRAEQEALLSELQITDAIQAQVVQTALQYLGVPYVWGGESPAGFDCSGLTLYVFAQHGVNLPHYAASQYKLGAPVPDNQLQAGDLVFWGPGHPHHVGMYIGNGKYIEAPTFGEVVKISKLNVNDANYAGARRYPLRAKSV
ncbi:MAG: C40 family peptidase [Thermoleophilia bacterium]|nr:C40 family peptidase [Thermoleophilia bacterium]